MAKNKAGLHKNISSIFDGVPIPKGGEKQPAHGPSTGRVGYVPPQSPPESPKTSPKPPEQTPVAPQPAKKVAGPVAGGRTAAFTAKKPASGWLAKRLGAPSSAVSGTRQKVMAMLIPVLLVFLIAVLVYNSGVISPKRPRHVSSAQPAGMEPAVPSHIEIPWQSPAEYAAAVPDPMARDFQTVAATGAVINTELIVTAIVYTPERAYATVGTTIVKEGDQIMGATVVKINPDSVEFERDAERWTQKVRDTEVRE